LGKPVTFQNRCAITSSGFVTTITVAFGACFFTASAAGRMMSAFALSRSVRDMPGFRGKPAVMITTSEPCDRRVVVRALDLAATVPQTRRLLHVERLALRHPLDDVDQHHVRERALGEIERSARAHVARADHRHLAIHVVSPSGRGPARSAGQNADAPRRSGREPIATGRVSWNT
jgi:hypothetical protein